MMMKFLADDESKGVHISVVYGEDYNDTPLSVSSARHCLFQ